MDWTLRGAWMLLCLGCSVASPIASLPRTEPIQAPGVGKEEPEGEQPTSKVSTPRVNKAVSIQTPRIESAKGLEEEEEPNAETLEQEAPLEEYPVAVRGALKWLLDLTHGYFPRTVFRVKRALTQVQLEDVVAAVDSAGFFLKDVNAAGDRTCFAEDVGVEQSEIASPCRDRMLHMLWEFRHSWSPDIGVISVEACTLDKGVMIRFGTGDYEVFVSEQDGHYFFRSVAYFQSEIH